MKTYLVNVKTTLTMTHYDTVAVLADSEAHAGDLARTQTQEQYDRAGDSVESEAIDSWEATEAALAAVEGGGA